MNIYDLIGWVGMILFLINYVLVSNGKAEATGKLYNWLQVFAAAASVLSLWQTRSYPFIALNTAFMLIGLCAILEVRPLHRLVTILRPVFKRK